MRSSIGCVLAAVALFSVSCSTTEEDELGAGESALNAAPEWTLFPASAVPENDSAYDGERVEVGFKFSSALPGTVKGVRFYKGAGNTGTHVGHLWSASGAKLATATFVNETASGWQEVRFTTPVSITAGATYVVSYHTNMGHYSFTHDGFAAEVQAAPLRAPDSSSVGGNGVYRYGPSGFPNQTYLASDYGVDVVFHPDALGLPSVPSQLEATAISAFAVDLRWTGASEGRGETQHNASGHRVYRGSTLVASLASGVTTFRDTGLSAATPYRYSVRGVDANGNLGPSSAAVEVTTGVDAPCTACSLWTDVTGNPQYENADTTPTEVGLKFRADVAGSVTKIRYYKGSTDFGEHVGHLWASDGTLLGTTVTAPAEEGFGWRELSFPTPVSLSANTVYVVSYFATGGRYAFSPHYFSTQGVDVGPLHAPASADVGGNAVRHLGGSAFPDELFMDSNYWVDVVFTP